MRALLLPLLLACTLTGCKKDLGEPCASDDECEALCFAALLNTELSQCTAQCDDPVCADAGGVCVVDLCMQPCSAGCPEGTVCHEGFGACVPACETDDDCPNEVCRAGPCE